MLATWLYLAIVAMISYQLKTRRLTLLALASFVSCYVHVENSPGAARHNRGCGLWFTHALYSVALCYLVPTVAIKVYRTSCSPSSREVLGRT